MGINPNKVFREIHETGVGLRGFYHGFEAALSGRMIYLFLRNFLHKIVYDQIKPVKASNDLTTREKAVLAAAVGGLAAYATSPFELIMTR
jgi:solute carrier family 25 oxoglutarate transporter 11